MEEKKVRESGIELLRIICMIGIIGLHIYGNFKNELTGTNMYIVNLYNCLFNIGVPCFVLISGYFGIKSDYIKLRKIHLMMLVYAFGDYAIRIVCGEAFQIRTFMHCFFPVFTRIHWYLSCYFVLAVLAPYLNMLSEKLDRKQHLSLVTSSLLIFNVLPVFPDFQITADGGKGVCQFVILYMLARYIRKYHVDRPEKRWRYFAAAVVMLGLAFGGNVILTILAGNPIGWLSGDGCILIILCALFIFLFFRTFTFSSRIINSCASCVVGIYVLEATVRLVLDPYIDFYDYYQRYELVFLVLLYASITLIISLMIEKCRRVLFGYIEDKYVKWEYGGILKLKEKVWMRISKTIKE